VAYVSTNATGDSQNVARNDKASVATINKELWYKVQKVRSVYTSLTARRGAPMQLLAGNPLTMMGGEFLRTVLRELDVTDLKGKKLRVISVIGAQSSAKSTLLNFLFGCEFQVSSGRCTCGLYASIFF